ncbi:hypothetical protein [Nitratifractor sp.]
MRKIFRYLVVVAVLAFSGCGMHLPLLESDVSLKLAQIDAALAKSFPKTLKSSFGEVTIVGAMTEPGNGEKQLIVLSRFTLVSFEIPEGIDGTVRFSGALRYDPKNRTLYLAQLKALKLTFNNPSLVEYVSDASRKGIPPLIASVLQRIPLKKMPNSFAARRIREITVNKKTVEIDFQ